MKKISITMISAFLLILSMNGSAAPTKTAQQIRLAMLDLNKLGLLKPISKPQSRLTVTKNKPITKQYPQNCMMWSKKMILEKSKRYDAIINKNARQFKLDSNLIRSVITAESCFRKRAYSTAGAKGLMQLIPATADRFGVKDSYDPKQNIRGGSKYLRFLLDRFKGNITKAIAGYNAGEGKVDKYKGIPPYKETRQYVKNVLKVYAWLSPKRKKSSRVKAVYQPPKLGAKPGRHGWQYNRRLAPHLYKQ